MRVHGDATTLSGGAMAGRSVRGRHAPPALVRVAPAAASLALRQALTGPPRPARVVHVGAAALHVAVADPVPGPTILTLVSAGGVRTPNALSCAGPAWTVLRAEVRPGADAEIGDGALRLGGLRVVVRRWWDPRPRLGAVTARGLTERLRDARSRQPPWPAAGPHAGPLREGRRRLEAALADGRDPDGAVAALVGLGPGATPSGDDLLAGTLAAWRLLGEALGVDDALAADDARLERLAGAVLARRTATAPLSATLLGHAVRGEVAVDAGGALAALAGHGDLERSFAALRRLGHRSGHDLAEGLLLGAHVALARARAEAVP